MVAVRPGQIVAVVGSDLIVLDTTAPDSLRLVGRLEIERWFRLQPSAGIVAPDGRTVAIQDGGITHLFNLPADGQPRPTGRIRPVSLGTDPGIAFAGPRIVRFEADNLMNSSDTSISPVALRWFDVANSATPRTVGSAFWSGPYGGWPSISHRVAAGRAVVFLVQVKHNVGSAPVDRVEALSLDTSTSDRRAPAMQLSGHVRGVDADGSRLWLAVQSVGANGRPLGEPSWQTVDGSEPLSPTIRSLGPQPIVPGLWTADGGFIWNVTDTDDRLDGVLSSIDVRDAEHPVPGSAIPVIGQVTAIDAWDGWVAVGSASGDIGLIEANAGVPMPRGWWPNDEPNRLPPLATATLSHAAATASPTPIIDRPALFVKIWLPAVLRRHVAPRPSSPLSKRSTFACGRTT